MLCWVDVVKQAATVSEIMANIYNVLNENNIEIPFPQRDVHIINKTE
jgi:small-conductance mechanosensitive channel